MSPTDPNPHPLDPESLAREIDRVARRVDGLDEAGRELWEHVRAIADRLSGDSGEQVKSPQSWFLITDPEQAVEVLTDLVEWLEAVYLRYQGSELPACWMWHGEVIEELRWLRRSHADAYAARMWGVPVGMWHDQQRPRTVERIRQLTALCDLEKHVSPAHNLAPPAAAPLKAHLEAVATAWATTALPPKPTAAQLQDSYAYEHRPVHTF